ncbi:MAG: DUF922 domain-containing protein [Saonia sp.]
MDTVRIIYAFVFFCAADFVHAQEFDTILWNAEQKLSWKDFKADPPKGGPAAAVTASGITYQFSSTLKGNEIALDFKVSTFFYPNKSWYKPELCDTVVLGHEQLHFDISELFARKMRKRLGETKFSKQIKAEVRAIYKKILRELSDFQNRYDTETNFSRNREQQFLWNKKVQEALRK